MWARRSGPSRPCARCRWTSPTGSSWCSSGRRDPARRPRCGCSPGWRRSRPASVYIGDREVNRIAPRERDIAMVFQDYALYPQMTVFDNLAFGLRRRKVAKAEIDRRVGGGRVRARARAAAAAPPGAVVRRPGPARGVGAGAGARAAGVPDGRAVVESRREAAHADARRDPAAAAGGRGRPRSTSRTTRSRR